METSSGLYDKKGSSLEELKKRILSFRGLVLVLQAFTLLVLVLVWHPWDNLGGTTVRKVTVTGTATRAVEPDQFLFTPTYGLEKIADATKLNSTIIAKLKSLGVQDGQIKNNAATYGSPEVYYLTPIDGKQKIVLSLSVTVKDKRLAQKVQDYLLTTNPQGSITPYPTISTEKQKQILNQARDEAIKDAREKAKKTAEGMGAKVDRVIEINEGTNPSFCFGAAGACPLMKMDTSVSSSSSPQETISIQPGTDDLTFNVTATFSLR